MFIISASIFQEEKATATVMFQKIANAYEVSECFSC